MARRRTSSRRRLTDWEIASTTAVGFFAACIAGAAVLNWMF